MRSHLRFQQHQHRAFTLIELLVVLAIIGLLTAILFPIFKSTRERSYQTNCATNLRQIGVALQLYKQDEKRYPESLRDLLPNTAEIPDYGTSTTIPNSNGTGFLKTTKDILTCVDDDSDDTLPRSSYGDISPDIFTGPTVAQDMGRFVWNYWGYNNEGIAYRDASEAASNTSSGSPLLVAPNDSLGNNQAYDRQSNPLKFSLSYRYAPPSTIVTHCVYHRLPTARDIDRPQDLYTASPSDARDARDIILRLDGSVKTLEVSGFKANGNWQYPTF